MIAKSKKYYSALFYFTLFTLLFGFNAAALASGKIAGKIISKSSGQPLPGANIIIEGSSLGAATNMDGEYFILNLAPGKYTLKASYMGFQAQSQSDVEVVTNRTTTINFQLEDANLQSNEIVISAVRPDIVKDVTASEQVISNETLSKTFVKSIPEALELQSGVFQGYYRGSTQVEALYVLDNVSLNSGLFSDNYTGINTSTIQEITLLTGGYNAEYGNARSAVISVTTKENNSGFHGTVMSRIRPAGTYHFGRDFYSTDNYDWKHFDLNYWTSQAKDPNSQFYNQDPQALLNKWHQQITPNDTLANYNKRVQYETEATFYGSFIEGLSYLISGRYKQGVNIYPQAIPYNPEFNFQGYINYKIKPGLEVRVSGLYGGWESCEDLATNFNSTESAQEAQWYSKMQVTDPYQKEKYSLLGAYLFQFPELRRWKQFTAKVTNFINPNTFFNITLGYLNDNMDRSDRSHVVPDSLYTLKDDKQKMVRYVDQAYQHAWDKSDSKVYQLQGDITSQVTTNHLLKGGFEFKYYDFWQNHFMIEAKGGGRENFVNDFSGTPYEGSAYIQDKMEFQWLVVNAGVRLDFFNQNRSAAKNMYDPLAFETTTPGHDPNEPYGYPGNPEKVKTITQYAFSPRIGISHPISDNTVFHFVYGHFYQRPSWSKMFGFPTVSYTNDDNAAQNQFGNQITYMEEWQGYYGNPNLGYEKTIQYELGFDQNISGIMKLNVTGYYKDATRIADFSSITGLYSATHFNNKALMVSNGGYADTRGIESKLETRLDYPLNLGASHEIYWSWDGVVGWSRLYEDGSGMIDVPKGLRNSKGAWSSYNKIKAWANLNFPQNYGPEIWGVKPLSDFYAFVYFWWRSGDPYTYHGPGDLSTEPNNKTWFNYYQFNLKVGKAFTFYGVRGEVSIDVENLLNSKFYRLLSGDDLTRWEERKDLPERDRLPKNSFSNEPDEWNWYTYEVPPRQMYFQVRFDF